MNIPEHGLSGVVTAQRMAWAVGRHARAAVRLGDFQVSIHRRVYHCLLCATLLTRFYTVSTCG